MLDRSLFLNPTFFISAMISFGSTYGVKTFSQLSTGNVGLFVFELTLYLTVIAVGLSGNITCITSLYLFSNLTNRLMEANLKAFLGSVVGMIATNVGVLLYALSTKSWNSVCIGLMMIAYMLVVFVIPPTLWVKVTKNLSQQCTTPWFHKPKWKYARFTLYSGMIILGLIGIHDMFEIS